MRVVGFGELHQFIPGYQVAVGDLICREHAPIDKLLYRQGMNPQDFGGLRAGDHCAVQIHTEVLNTTNIVIML